MDERLDDLRQAQDHFCPSGPFNESMHRLGWITHVPRRPISFYEQPGVWGLWHQLEEQCSDGTNGCEVMVIPHNINSSNGIMFHPDSMHSGLDGEPKLTAALRARMEPIVGEG